MNEIDWVKVRAEVEAEVIADKTAKILADADAYECAACCIEGQPCDVGLAVRVERERIIKLITDDKEVGYLLYWWYEDEDKNRLNQAIAIFNGETNE
jgi:hypothetical protein